MKQRRLSGQEKEHGRRTPLARLLLRVVMLSLAGCITTQGALQPKTDEPEADKPYDVQTISDLSRAYASATPQNISGVGLVTQLEGTGGDSPPGEFRRYLESQLAQQRFDHVSEMLKSPDNAMVFVSASIPAGAHKGDLIDVDITLPAGSRATSLRGGYLMKCKLVNYDTLQNVAPHVKSSELVFGTNQLLLGHTLAIAEGPVLVGFDTQDDASKVLHARIWGGARAAHSNLFLMRLPSTRGRTRNGPRYPEMHDDQRPH